MVIYAYFGKFSKNVEYKIDHTSKTKNHKTLKVSVASDSNHCASSGVKKNIFHKFLRILSRHISKNKNWKIVISQVSGHCTSFTSIWLGIKLNVGNSPSTSAKYNQTQPANIIHTRKTAPFPIGIAYFKLSRVSCVANPSIVGLHELPQNFQFLKNPIIKIKFAST